MGTDISEHGRSFTGTLPVNNFGLVYQTFWFRKLYGF